MLFNQWSSGGAAAGGGVDGWNGLKAEMQFKLFKFKFRKVLLFMLLTLLRQILVFIVNNNFNIFSRVRIDQRFKYGRDETFGFLSD